MDISPVGRLSPELRNRIYELTFTIDVHLDKFGNNATALIRTCREIRNEARLLLLSHAPLRLSPDFLANTLSTIYEYPLKEPFGNMIAESFGESALAILKTRDIIFDCQENRRICLGCDGCYRSARRPYPFLPGDEVKDLLRFEILGYYRACQGSGKEGQQEDEGSWSHGGWSCWKV